MRLLGLKSISSVVVYPVLLGWHWEHKNFLSVAIAMQFRLVVGFLLWICKNHMLGVILSGPIASTVARLTLSVYVGKGALAMVMLACTWYDFYCCL